MIWLFFIFLSVVALTLMAMPLRSKMHANVGSEDTTPAVLLDQLDEVQRDLDRSVISAAEAKAAEQEIKRRILMQSRKATTRKTGSVTGGRIGLILSAAFVPLFAFGYYTSMGSPEIPGIAFADRAAERQEAAKMR